MAAFLTMIFMHPYQSLNNDTGVIAYQNGEDHIAVQFMDGTVYLYTNKSAGQDSIIQMKKLAKAGAGLTTYINQHVKDHYEAKIK